MPDEVDVEKSVEKSSGEHKPEMTSEKVVIQQTESTPLSEDNDGQRAHNERTSLLYRITHVTAQDTHIGIIQKSVSYVFGSVGGIIALIVVNAIQIIMIITGSVYAHDCPREPGIPVILIVNGSILLTLSIIEGVRRNINNESNIIPKLNIITTTLKIASTVAFLAWCFLVYSVYKPDFENTSSKDYCNSYLYLYAFWLLNSIIIISGVLLLLSCCCCWFKRQ